MIAAHSLWECTEGGSALSRRRIITASPTGSMYSLSPCSPGAGGEIACTAACGHPSHCGLGVPLLSVPFLACGSTRLLAHISPKGESLFLEEEGEWDGGPKTPLLLTLCACSWGAERTINHHQRLLSLCHVLRLLVLLLLPFYS